jgi:hypothetical protein
MSHREEPRSGRGCFGAVVVVPFLALGGMFALIALTGSPDEAPLAAPPPSRPTSQWWTEPFETGTTLSTVTETVVLEGQAREVRAARLATATATRVAVSTVTETVQVGAAKPSAAGRNEPEPPWEDPVSPSSSDTSSPVVTSSSVVPGPPASEPPVTSAPGAPAEPSTVPPVSSAPRSEDPVPPSTTPATPTAPPCDRSEPGPSEPSGPAEPSESPERSESSESSELSESGGEVLVEVGVELPLAFPAEVLSTSSAPLAGV